MADTKHLIDDYAVLSDRIKSLLERWDKYHDINPYTYKLCIHGLLAEINDEFTAKLAE